MTDTMPKKPIFRLIVFMLVLLMMAALLVKALYDLTVVHGDEYYSVAQNESLNTIKTKGRRGSILDRNGLVLAYDETCFNVCFMRDGNNRSDYDSAVYTEALIKAIGIINDGGMKTIDTSYIRMDENGEYYYDFGSKNEKTIRSRYKNFCNACGFHMRDPDDMSTWISAENAYLELREAWFIPEEMPFSEAVKIISVRQDVLLNDYRSYEPVIIAADVSEDIVAKLEMEQLPGIETRISTRRVYPYGYTAAHILGYCQSMTEENAETYLALGYGYDDKIGVSGIEATMENYLTGCTSDKQGSTVIKTNANKSVIEVISVEPATDGGDVTLTIDLPMQMAAEAALKEVIVRIHEKQLDRIDPDRDGNYDDKYAEYDRLELAKTGAIVVMDVNTGEVLAMASYPSFDPNWFVKGLTAEQAEYLYSGEEAGKTTPARNKAISMKLAPGSIFKMCTGIAGLLEGAIGIYEHIDDESPYYVKDPDTGEIINQNPVKCWTSYPERHAAQTVVEALKNSCNYYFCEVASRIGINSLAKWAKRLGLADKTGVELTGEAVGIIGGQSVLYDNTRNYDEQDTSLPVLIHRALVTRLRGYQETRGVESSDEAYSRCADRLMKLQDGSLVGKGTDVRRILSEELGIPDGISRSTNWVNEIMSLLNEIQWKPTLTIRTGIGQSIMLVTPIAAVRYAAAIANGGTVYDAHIVKSAVSSKGETLLSVEPTIFDHIDAPEEYWEAIKKGMAEVVSPEDGGTAGEAFGEDFKEKGYLARISGKTGSAQVGNITVDVQNTGWFVAFAPNDDPDIAVCVCIPNGYSGSSTAGAIEDVLTYYFSKLEARSPETLVEPDSVLP
jgi:penicillin-binding protein 2